MKRNKFYALILSFLSFLFSCTVFSQEGPYIRKEKSQTSLMVNGKPFLALAGEIGNSSSSSLKYMDTIWPKLKQINVNTVLVPAYWELVEPIEGQFDFTLIDGIIEKARVNDLKIVFLWFGSWKNMVSTYVPSWVKGNTGRFPLLEDVSGRRMQILSAFSEANMQADASAFSMLMRHIKKVDVDHQTVIMMQVENEVGCGCKRDCSKLANAAYKKQVPKDLMNYLMAHKKTLIPEFKKEWEANGAKAEGSWGEVFGPDSVGDEIFMSYYFSKYIGHVIEKGKQEYNIPMFVNASVGRFNLKMSTYPSGGPVPLVMDIWHCAAPSLDILCPDIYFGNFDYLCEKYTQGGNPLFIPETRGGDVGVAHAMQAIGNYKALGFSPFFIEHYVGDPIVEVYDKFKQISPVILGLKDCNKMIAATIDAEESQKSVVLGDYSILCDKGKKNGHDVGCALIIENNSNEYYIMGKNINLQFYLKNSKKDMMTGILMDEEGYFNQDVWVAESRLNGDQIMIDYDFVKISKEGRSGDGLKFGDKISIQHVKLYNY